MSDYDQDLKDSDYRIQERAMTNLELDRFRATEMGGELSGLCVDPDRPGTLNGTVTTGFRVGTERFNRGELVSVDVGRNWGCISHRPAVRLIGH